jgi:hypothetical protein
MQHSFIIFLVNFFLDQKMLISIFFSLKIKPHSLLYFILYIFILSKRCWFRFFFSLKIKPHFLLYLILYILILVSIPFKGCSSFAIIINFLFLYYFFLFICYSQLNDYYFIFLLQSHVKHLSLHILFLLDVIIF